MKAGHVLVGCSSCQVLTVLIVRLPLLNHGKNHACSTGADEQVMYMTGMMDMSV